MRAPASVAVNDLNLLTHQGNAVLKQRIDAAAVRYCLGRKAEKRLLPMQPGDVTATYADISKLNALCGYQPRVPLKIGLEKFVAWWRQYENG